MPDLNGVARSLAAADSGSPKAPRTYCGVAIYLATVSPSTLRVVRPGRPGVHVTGINRSGLENTQGSPSEPAHPIDAHTADPLSVVGWPPGLVAPAALQASTLGVQFLTVTKK